MQTVDNVTELEAKEEKLRTKIPDFIMAGLRTPGRVCVCFFPLCHLMCLGSNPGADLKHTAMEGEVSSAANGGL